jgi:DNA helicase-2/ATP-dependent DNA helicase PcrA
VAGADKEGTAWMLDLSELNDAQAAAVRAGDGPQLVLAGPGTGKTRTLVSRFAFLVDRGVDPRRILTLTFTRKAADEMVDRVKPMLSSSTTSGLWVGTFHALAGRMLRSMAEDAGLTPDFRIFDAQRQQRLLIQLGIHWDADNGGELLDIIAAAKDHLLAPEDYRQMARDKIDLEGKHLRWMLAAADAYATYQEALKAQNGVDFGDMINHVVDLMRRDDDIRQRVSRQFDHVLVDEFQDVNPAQVEFLRLLTATHTNLWAVGDDDQTLYGFRASDVKHILEFPKRYDGTKIHKLQENYRSTGNILAPALALIAHNQRRFAKNVHPTKSAGSRVVVAEHDDEAKEALWIVASVQKLIEAGVSYGEIAVLCRAGHIGSRLQLTFREHSIPVLLRGVQDFWSSPEVKAVTGILTLARDPQDHAARLNLGRGRRSEMFARVASEIGDGVDRDYAAAVAKAVRVVANVKMPNRSDEYKDRWARNTRLAGEIARTAGGLDALRAQIATEQRGLREKTQDAVVLSTVHSAKGLEWDAVFVAAFEDGLMPHKLGPDTEEERRIAFVAITRAKRYLAVTYANSRDGELAGPSPFLKEALATLNGDTVDWRARTTAPWIVAERKRAKAQRKRQRKRGKATKREAGAATGTSGAGSNKSPRASPDMPMVGSVQGTRYQADWSDGELANLVRLYHASAGEVLTLAQSVYRTPAEVAERILIEHYGIAPAADECAEGRLFLEAADRVRLPTASQEIHARLMHAIGAYLPAKRVRAWLVTPRTELTDLSPGAYVSRVRGGIQAIVNILEHAPAAETPGNEQPPDATG